MGLVPDAEAFSPSRGLISEASGRVGKFGLRMGGDGELLVLDVAWGWRCTAHPGGFPKLPHREKRDLQTQAQARPGG